MFASFISFSVCCLHFLLHTQQKKPRPNYKKQENKGKRVQQTQQIKPRPNYKK